MKLTWMVVRAVLFDMDGVITDTMPYHYQAWRSVLSREEGILVSHQEIYEREGQEGGVSVRELLEAHQKIYTRVKGTRILLAKEALFKRLVRPRFIPGARGILAMMKRAGIPLALVTGTSRHEMMRLLPSKILRCFDVSVTGRDVKRGKPDPEPYLKALMELNVNARDALVIENAPFGILSAKTAGITCFAIATSLPACYLKKADRVFSSFKEMKTQFRFQDGGFSVRTSSFHEN